MAIRAALQQEGPMTDPSNPAREALSLPRGGGAVQGIGETFQAQLCSGTANHSVPLALSPGRHGFGPQLALQYSSGHGNGPFGLGWRLDLARVSRKTEKGLPLYDDDQDSFVLAGAEDLVRTAHGADGTWTPEAPRLADGYRIYRYRPRTEGLFARIERWVREADGFTHWRTITSDQITHCFGTTADSRLADPQDPRRVSDWLLQQSYDALGNHCVYEYAADEPALYGTDPSQRLGELFERGRSATQRYLRRICYGNAPEPLVDADGRPVTHPDGSPVGVLRGGRRYLFEAVFDYGDWAWPTTVPHPAPPADGTVEWFGTATVAGPAARPAPLREDRFSQFRTGFEVRTLRRCERVLMFHHMAELGGPTLVRSTDFHYEPDPDTRTALLRTVTVTSHAPDGEGGYRSASLPPLSLGYAGFQPHAQRLQTLQAAGGQMPRVPLNDASMAVVDLLGDGLPDLVQTGPAGLQVWRNLGDGRFDRPRRLESVPAGVVLGQPGIGFGDMSGNGVADLLVHDGALPGFYESTGDGGWHRFQPYASAPAFDPADRSVRLLDLTGDGRADALRTEDQRLVWYPCLGDAGFGAARVVPRLHDRDRFPDVFFDDPQGRVRLADMTGDGLNDIVEVHDGGIDYWPNRGYGRFGPRVRMAQAPRLGSDFDPRRLFLVDLNGTGCADVVYVDARRVHFWFNQSGNGFSDGQTLTGTPYTPDPASLTFADIFGSGTATLLWSPAAGGASEATHQALDFCGGVKPFVLTEVDNGMGACTRLTYGSSTRHYLRDRAQGQPWLTALPFPVQVLDRVETIDRVAHTRGVTSYRYHHGFFDGREREFRGFARVDQFDAEELDAVAPPVDAAGYLNADPAVRVPPVETRTWFHTGVWMDEGRFEQQLRAEFYAQDPQALPLPPHRLPVASTTPAAAARALRGAVLRTEVYAQDGTPRAAHPYRASESRYEVAELQPALPLGAGLQPGVYHCHALEALSYHYERRPADPRITHELTLETGPYGQPLRRLAIGYGRRQPDASLPGDDDRARQTTPLITYTEHRYTPPLDDPLALPDVHRVPTPCESLTYELTGYAPADGLRFRWEDWAADDFAALDQAETLPYERPGDGSSAQKRVLQHTRTRLRSDDLSRLLPLGVIEPRALPGQTFQRAFTQGLLASVYGGRVDAAALAAAGYVQGDDADADPGWWLPSPQVFFSPQDGDAPADELAYAQAHFFAPCRSRDPFGHTAVSRYDPYVLAVVETSDALGNTVQVALDYRVLQPARLTDANGNRSQVVFDTLGLVAGSAAMGKAGEGLGDSLDGFVADLDDAQCSAFLADPLGQAAALLGPAGRRVVHDVGRFGREGQALWTATLTREVHASDAAAGEPPVVQVELCYVDGSGRAIQKKVPAEPGPLVDGGPVVETRWVGSGWTVFNNKGLPVRQYEPFFDDGPGYRFDLRNGVATLRFYDPCGRAVATLYPDHRWEKTVFDPWQQACWDSHDTALLTDPAQDEDVGPWFARLDQAEYLPTWHAQRQSETATAAERDAAAKTAAHAGTPELAHADVLGRTFLTRTHNRFERDGATVEEFSFNRVMLDVEGRTRAVVDALGRTIVRTDYGLQGGALHHASMEAGERWVLPDVGGQVVRTWDSRGQAQRHVYDALRRPVQSFVTDSGGVERLLSRTEYGEGADDALARNLRGRPWRQFDTAGLLVNTAYDFKGNLVDSSRQVLADHRSVVDWQASPALDGEVFRQVTRYDALDRPVWLQTPDGSIARPRYNRARLLAGVEAQLHGAGESLPFVTAVEYDAKGQRTAIHYGNGVSTFSNYDPASFRLARCRTVRGDTALQDLALTYDAAGNLTQVADAAQQTVYFRNQVVTPDNDYTYDALYRLVRAAGREHIGQVSQPETSWDDRFRVLLPHPNDGQAMRRYDEAYDYDAAGNLLRLVHQAANGNWTRECTYAEASLTEPERFSNRLSQVQVGSSTEHFPYDAHGNITAMSHLAELAWDPLDRLHSAALPGDGRVYYQYDAGGRRVRKVVEKNQGALVEERISLGHYEVFRRRNAADAVLVEHQTLHLMDDRRRIALIETRTIGSEAELPSPLVRYQHGTPLGSATLELDGAGQVITYEEYYPYGCTSYQAGRSVVEVNLKRLRFTGMERDEETGLACHGARYYAPWLGRWIACDPAGLADGNNIYAYCRGRPTWGVDPSGLGVELCNPFTDSECTLGSTLSAAAEVASTEVVPRVVGAGKAAAGLGGMAIGAGLCETGLGCAFGGPLALASADYGGSGLSQMIDGDSHPTVVGQLGGAKAQAVESAVVEGANLADLGIMVTGKVLASKPVQKLLGQWSRPAAPSAASSAAGSDTAVLDAFSRRVDAAVDGGAVGSERVWLAGDGTGGAETVAVRFGQSRIAFDSQTNATAVQTSLEMLARRSPGTHVVVGSGTHGALTGTWAPLDASIAEPVFLAEDLATAASPSVAALGPRTVVDVAAKGGGAAYMKATSAASAAPPGTLVVVDAWCYSSGRLPLAAPGATTAPLGNLGFGVASIAGQTVRALAQLGSTLPFLNH